MSSACAAGALVRGHDHLAHDQEPALGHEHVLSAAEADPLRAELAGLGRVLGRVGVRAHLQAAQRVGPLEHGSEVLVDLRRDEIDGADDHVAGPAVDRDHVALGHLVVAQRRRLPLRVDREVLAAGDARFAHAARDHGRVGGHAAVRGQDPGRLDQAVDVVRRRLPADEDHLLARLAALGGGVGVEHDLAGGRARGGIQALARDVVARVRVEHRVQELVELAGIDARDRLLARDQSLVHHLDRGPERGRRRALRAPGLEEIELALLDRELDVLHVAVVLLEALDRLHQLVEGLGHPLLHRLERLRRADAGDNVLPLRVGEELAVQAALAGGRIAREENAGAAVVAPVAEDHLHDVDRSAEVVGDALRGAVDLRARRVPGFEDGADGAAQLLARVGGEQTARLRLVDPAEGRDQLGEVVAVELHVLLDALERSSSRSAPARSGTRRSRPRPRRTSGSGGGTSRRRSACCRSRLRAPPPPPRSGRG